MAVIPVWAPYARHLDIVVDDVRYPMTPSGRGWWEAEIAELGPGSHYGFSLEGGPTRPDPRSASQPEGVHGPSLIVDHSAFRWHDQLWRGRPLESAVVYELHVGTFTPEGTLDAVIPQLDHLVHLGIGVVELMPVAEFVGGRGWGYDGVSLYAPHSRYGGPDGLKRLVDACHARGLAVALDVVYNHLGPCGNYMGEFGPYFTDRHTTPWGMAVNFDGRGSDEVRAFVLDNAEMWITDYHFDGLRIDAVHAIHDESATHVLAELGQRIDQLQGRLGRTLFVVAESDLNDPDVVGAREAGGHGLSAQWNDDFHHALHALLTGERTGYYGDFGRVDQLAKALRAGFVYDGGYSAFRDRKHGRALAPGTPAGRLLAYSQNHDQVGNRAVGDRSGRLVSVGRLHVAAALVLTSPFVPMLFMGEEWGASTPFLYFTDHDDPALGRAVSAGRQHEFADFGWQPDDVPDPQDPATMDRSKLQWEEAEKPEHAELLDWYRLLIHLRSEVPDLAPNAIGQVEVTYDETDGWLMVKRGRVVVAANIGSSQVELALPVGTGFELAASPGAALTAHGASLAPDSVLVAG